MLRTTSTIKAGALLVACVALFISSADAADSSPDKQADAAAREQARGPYCGLYSVYGALSVLGQELEFESLVEPKYIGSWRGSSIDELKRAAEDHGAHAEILTGLGAATLENASQPMILHVASDGQLKEYNHWVLFLGLKGGQARIIDPPDPEHLMPLAELLAIWDGAALAVSDRSLDRNGLVASEHWEILNYVVLVAGVLVLLYLLGTSDRRQTIPEYRDISRRLARVGRERVSWQVTPRRPHASRQALLESGLRDS